MNRLNTDFANRAYDDEANLDPYDVREPMPVSASGAKRENLNRTPYDLIPFEEIAESYARVAEFGAKKYSPWNWTLGLPRVQLLGSLLSHTFKYLRGTNFDKESGLSHIDHMLWNVIALVHAERHNIQDNRRREPSRNYSTGNSGFSSKL
jgi:hypothetical protein